MIDFDNETFKKYLSLSQRERIDAVRKAKAAAKLVHGKNCERFLAKPDQSHSHDQPIKDDRVLTKPVRSEHQSEDIPDEEGIELTTAAAGENITGRWIADTGSGIDLIGKDHINVEAKESSFK